MKLLDNPLFIKIIKEEKVIILLDNSCGRGIQEEKESYQKKINRCLEKGINNIGLAGGFGPETVDVFLALRNYYQINFSIDAESNLRRNGKLDISKVKKYLNKLLTPSVD